MRRAAPLLLSIVLLAACGGEEESTPAACYGGARVFEAALEKAPAQARLTDDVAISECLVEDQPTGELQRVGAALVSAATRLNSVAQRDPAGPAPVRLGYLVGAVQRGAADTGGIHADLVRRIESAAQLSPGGGRPPRAFRQGYEKGYAGGRSDG